jgi:K+-sensing histidine kinase KdpD
MNRPRFVRGHLIRIDLGRESIAASLEVRHDLLMRAVAGSVAAVAAASALVYALQPIAPTLSLGALYTLAVLAVAVLFGAAYGVVVAVASMVAFNFFFLRPVHTLTLADARNWTALAVYLAVAIVASQLATRARNRAALAEQREREASFLADIAAEILQTGSVEDLPARAAGVVDSADRVARERLQAALDTLLGMSRSDAIKTTILQAVSHDFRTPLATMAAAVDGLESGDLTLSDADRAELLETVRLELARLTRLVENLLDLSRIRAGGVAPRLELWSNCSAQSPTWSTTRSSTRLGRSRCRRAVTTAACCSRCWIAAAARRRRGWVSVSRSRAALPPRTVARLPSSLASAAVRARCCRCRREGTRGR